MLILVLAYILDDYFIIVKAVSQINNGVPVK